jgi:hypothetical protein
LRAGKEQNIGHGFRQTFGNNGREPRHVRSTCNTGAWHGSKWHSKAPYRFCHKRVPGGPVLLGHGAVGFSCSRAH